MSTFENELPNVCHRYLEHAIGSLHLLHRTVTLAYDCYSLVICAPVTNVCLACITAS